jgi:hypothetical protein
MLVRTCRCVYEFRRELVYVREREREIARERGDMDTKRKTKTCTYQLSVVPIDNGIR